MAECSTTKTKANFKEIAFEEIEKIILLGSGSFGTVYKAVWKDKYVAVKEFNILADKKEIETEIKQLSRVDHPNIIILYGVSVTETTTNLVMDYAEGGSLYNLLHGPNGAKYTAAQAMNWSRQCAEGVAYMHAMQPKPLIHRDLKSPNLLLFDHGRCLKICDFGTVADKATEMTNCKGTARWMAPEVFTSSNYTEKCDVFSWSIVLWEIFAREIPFAQNKYANLFTILWQTNKGRRPDLNRLIGCPPSIENLMKQCWDPEPYKRPSMREVVELIKSSYRHSPAADEPIHFNSDTTSNNESPYKKKILTIINNFIIQRNLPNPLYNDTANNTKSNRCNRERQYEEHEQFAEINYFSTDVIENKILDGNESYKRPTYNEQVMELPHRHSPAADKIGLKSYTTSNSESGYTRESPNDSNVSAISNNASSNRNLRNPLYDNTANNTKSNRCNRERQYEEHEQFAEINYFSTDIIENKILNGNESYKRPTYNEQVMELPHRHSPAADKAIGLKSYTTSNSESGYTRESPNDSNVSAISNNASSNRNLRNPLYDNTANNTKSNRCNRERQYEEPEQFAEINYFSTDIIENKILDGNESYKRPTYNEKVMELPHRHSPAADKAIGLKSYTTSNSESGYTRESPNDSNVSAMSNNASSNRNLRNPLYDNTANNTKSNRCNRERQYEEPEQFAEINYFSTDIIENKILDGNESYKRPTYNEQVMELPHRHSPAADKIGLKSYTTSNSESGYTRESPNDSNVSAISNNASSNRNLRNPLYDNTANNTKSNRCNRERQYEEHEQFAEINYFSTDIIENKILDGNESYKRPTYNEQVMELPHRHSPAADKAIGLKSYTTSNSESGYTRESPNDSNVSAISNNASSNRNLRNPLYDNTANNTKSNRCNRERQYEEPEQFAEINYFSTDIIENKILDGNESYKRPTYNEKVMELPHRHSPAADKAIGLKSYTTSNSESGYTRESPNDSNVSAISNNASSNRNLRNPLYDNTANNTKSNRCNRERQYEEHEQFAEINYFSTDIIENKISDGNESYKRPTYNEQLMELPHRHSPAADKIGLKSYTTSNSESGYTRESPNDSNVSAISNNASSNRNLRNPLYDNTANNTKSNRCNRERQYEEHEQFAEINYFSTDIIENKISDGNESYKRPTYNEQVMELPHRHSPAADKAIGLKSYTTSNSESGYTRESPNDSNVSAISNNASSNRNLRNPLYDNTANNTKSNRCNRERQYEEHEQFAEINYFSTDIIENKILDGNESYQRPTYNEQLMELPHRHSPGADKAIGLNSYTTSNSKSGYTRESSNNNYISAISNNASSNRNLTNPLYDNTASNTKSNRCNRERQYEEHEQFAEINYFSTDIIENKILDGNESYQRPTYNEQLMELPHRHSPGADKAIGLNSYTTSNSKSGYTRESSNNNYISAISNNASSNRNLANPLYDNTASNTKSNRCNRERQYEEHEQFAEINYFSTDIIENKILDGNESYQRPTYNEQLMELPHRHSPGADKAIGLNSYTTSNSKSGYTKESPNDSNVSAISNNASSNRNLRNPLYDNTANNRKSNRCNRERQYEEHEQFAEINYFSTDIIENKILDGNESYQRPTYNEQVMELPHRHSPGADKAIGLNSYTTSNSKSGYTRESSNNNYISAISNNVSSNRNLTNPLYDNTANNTKSNRCNRERQYEEHEQFPEINYFSTDIIENKILDRNESYNRSTYNEQLMELPHRHSPGADKAIGLNSYTTSNSESGYTTANNTNRERQFQESEQFPVINYVPTNMFEFEILAENESDKRTAMKKNCHSMKSSYRHSPGADEPIDFNSDTASNNDSGYTMGLSTDNISSSISNNEPLYENLPNPLNVYTTNSTNRRERQYQKTENESDKRTAMKKNFHSMKSLCRHSSGADEPIDFNSDTASNNDSGYTMGLSTDNISSSISNNEPLYENLPNPLYVYTTNSTNRRERQYQKTQSESDKRIAMKKNCHSMKSLCRHSPEADEPIDFNSDTASNNDSGYTMGLSTDNISSSISNNEPLYENLPNPLYVYTTNSTNRRERQYQKTQSESDKRTAMKKNFHSMKSLCRHSPEADEPIDFNSSNNVSGYTIELSTDDNVSIINSDTSSYDNLPKSLYHDTANNTNRKSQHHESKQQFAAKNYQSNNMIENEFLGENKHYKSAKTKEINVLAANVTAPKKKTNIFNFILKKVPRIFKKK